MIANVEEMYLKRAVDLFHFHENVTEFTAVISFEIGDVQLFQLTSSLLRKSCTVELQCFPRC